MELWWTANAVVGWIFLSAGIAKLVKFEDFAREVHERSPRLPRHATALAIALTETWCGAYMLVGADVRGAALTILGMLAVFSAVALKKPATTCGCGGLAEFRSGRPHAVANLTLAVLAAAIFIAGPAATEWSPGRAATAYLALALLLSFHVLAALQDVRRQRLLIDQQRFGG